MAGTWTGNGAKGDTAEVTYKVMAGGTSVMADIKMGDEAMTSMYYVDGDRLLMTHFCPSNNQPRMKAAISPDGKTVTFDFVDATNLASPQTGHMHRGGLRFLRTRIITAKTGHGSTRTPTRTFASRCNERSELTAGAFVASGRPAPQSFTTPQ